MTNKLYKLFESVNYNSNEFMRKSGMLDVQIIGEIVEICHNPNQVKYRCGPDNHYVTLDLIDRLTRSLNNINEIQVYINKHVIKTGNDYEYSAYLLLKDIELVNAVIDNLTSDAASPDVLYNAYAIHRLPCFVAEPDYSYLAETDLMRMYYDNEITAANYLLSISSPADKKRLAYNVRNDIQMVTSILDFIIRNKMPLRRCPVCGKLFLSERGNYKYCSPACKETGYRKVHDNSKNKPLKVAIKNMKQRIKANTHFADIPEEQFHPKYLQRETVKQLIAAKDAFIEGRPEYRNLIQIALSAVVHDYDEQIKSGKMNEEEIIDLLNDFGRVRCSDGE